MGVYLVREFPVLLGGWWTYPRSFSVAPASAGILGFKLKALTFSLNSHLLMYAVGALVGLRGCISMTIGAIIAWAVLAPNLLHTGNIRLEVKEPLLVLPEGVSLPDEPDGFTKYRELRQELSHKGAMTPGERDALLAQSADPLYQEVVHRLFLRSQIGLQLEPDRDSGGLKATAESTDFEFDAAQRAALPASLEAYTTTRAIQISTPLAAWPASSFRFPFTLPETLTLPRAYAKMLKYDQKRKVLIAHGRPDVVAVAAVGEVTQAFAARHPDQAAACDALLAAVTSLNTRSIEALLPDAWTVPDALNVVLGPDSSGMRLTFRGIMSDEQQKTLLAAVPSSDAGHADYAATIRALHSGAKFAPVRAGFSGVVQWLLWPGVTLMVVASLTSFAFSWRGGAACLSAVARRRRAARHGRGDAQVVHHRGARSPGAVGGSAAFVLRDRAVGRGRRRRFHLRARHCGCPRRR